MLKKIYSLLASILLLSACTTDDMIQEKNQTDDSKVVLSFQVDVPSAEVITKSTSVPGDEVGVSNLQLVTFDGNDQYIETVAAKSISNGKYSASISKETRNVQFVANYDGYKSLTTKNAVSTAATNEYAFFAEQNLSEGFSSIKDVELLRNWSKISLTNNSVLTDVQFMVYNASTKATIALGDNEINIPSGNGLNTTPSFVEGKKDIHAFEQITSGDSPAFIIVKAKYNNEETYYKLDLAVTNVATGIVTNYDIKRNYWYKITIKSVQRKGVSWNEVIKSGKIADNNITASAELDKYPSISFGGETLEVTKTTYVFTKAGEGLSMLATYTKNSNANYSGLSLVQSPDELTEVVDGTISKAQEGYSARITATIKEIPASGEKRGFFYVKGGGLQRKITLIVRKPYGFENVYFYKDKPNANTPYNEGTTNKITSGPEIPIWLGFTIPESVDASIFPLECKIESNTLYSVTDGVRIEAAPEGDGKYYYIFTAKNPGRHFIQFKTNATVSGETVKLTADYFVDNSTGKYLTTKPNVLTGTIKFAKNETSGNNISSDEKVSCFVDDVEMLNLIVGSKGSYTVSLPYDISNNAKLRFSYKKDNLVYAFETTYGEFVSNTDITLRCKVKTISGNASYSSSSTGNGNAIRNGNQINYTNNSGLSGSFYTTNNSGGYSFDLPFDIADDVIVVFSYTRYSTDYILETTVSELKKNGNIVLRKQ